MKFNDFEATNDKGITNLVVSTAVNRMQNQMR